MIFPILTQFTFHQNNSINSNQNDHRSHKNRPVKSPDTGTFQAYFGMFAVWREKTSINHLKYSTKK